ncbi:LysR substrate-binding domain-containing protein [Polaromonas sp. JS666]|uniref:LysR substrate-binding domain-containing protein n=1 Tax=Polaromonas sp. (strain JS666 / ATCC BAA-500) TaxID=296591 RepID=UPI00005321AA|nr:LysR substrate-binding domain-containing protein [Polaromonas sp. JS666]ABE42482.1 transcriptional regulator, LysR family [Polaromonas sp. JS666]
MDKIESITAFVSVARAGGFSAASREIGVPLATLSRRVAELETSLGVRLFHRSTRQIVLTESGIGYFAACQHILEYLKDAEETVVGEYRSPKGELSITAPVGFGRQHLQPVATEFLRAYPDIDLRLLLVDRMVDLVGEHLDLAVRISTLSDSGQVARSVGEIKMIVFGAPGYLKARGMPKHPSELVRHSCISWTSLGPYKAWLFREGGLEAMFPIRARLTTTTPESAITAAVAELGLVQATSYQAEDAVRSGLLIPVLRDFEALPTPVSLVYPSSRLVPLKLRVFLDFAAPRLAARLESVAKTL